MQSRPARRSSGTPRGRRAGVTVQWPRERRAQLGMPVHKRLHVRGRRGLANGIRHVDREKIRVREKAIDRFEPDVIGIHMPAFRPAQRSHGGLRRSENARRFGADERVFAVRFVPDRNHVRAVRGDLLAGAELRLRLMRKAVADADGEFFESEHFCERAATIAALRKMGIAGFGVSAAAYSG